MTLSVNIKTKYVRVGDVMVQCLHVTALEDVTLPAGGSLIINPKDGKQIKIDVTGHDSIPTPYYA